jgi:Tol biopolymer transport system component
MSVLLLLLMLTPGTLQPFGDTKAHASFPGVNGKIAYAAFYGAGHFSCGGAIWLMNADGSDPFEVPGTRDCGSSPALSADGTRIAFTRGDFDFERWGWNPSRLFIVNVDGTNMTALTDYPAIYPSFSPDGTQILFTGSRDGKFGIYLMDLDESLNTIYIENTENGRHASFSPDGTKITFMRDIQIYIMNADGSGQINLTNDTGYGLYPSFSPDGKKILFAGGRDSQSGIFVMDVDGTNVKRLKGLPSGSDPVWSPDGTKIAYSSFRNGNSEIYVIDADGTNEEQLTDNSNIWAIRGSPSWAPDPFAPIPITEGIVISDDASCLALSEYRVETVWNSTNSSCLIKEGKLLISSSGSLVIDASVILEVDEFVVFENEGAISNSGTIENHGQLKNTGIISTSGDIRNRGSIDNLGTISNSNTIDNLGIIENSGWLFNSGYINSEILAGQITGSGTIVNSGYMR